MTKDLQAAAREGLADLTVKISELTDMTIGELRQVFLEEYGYPTNSRNKVYLRKKIAWQIQAKAEGGLSQRALDRIDELAPLAPVRWRQQATIAMPPEAPPPEPKKLDPRLPEVGSFLSRKYKNEVHKVKVLADGFVYKKQKYASLSRVARAITGTNWNGFTFFNLTGAKQ
jgi:Protein of unknown function (DUF2924)